MFSRPVVKEYLRTSAFLTFSVPLISMSALGACFQEVQRQEKLCELQVCYVTTYVVLGGAVKSQRLALHD